MASETVLSSIATTKIFLSGWNPRKNFDPGALEELKSSIQEHGILEPLIIRPNPNAAMSNIQFELVAGERRFRAAQELGLKKVPVVIRDLSDRDVREIMLIENLQRSQLEPLEEAEAIEVLLQDGTTQEQLGRKLGKSQSWIANRLRLFKAPEKLKEMIISRKITPKHVNVLLPYQEYPVFRDIMADLEIELAKNDSVSVTNLEKRIMNVISDIETKNTANLDDIDWDYSKLEGFFDLKECKDCPDIRVVPSWNDEPERYCLNMGCFSDVLKKAQEKYDKSIKRLLEKKSVKDTVDISQLEYGTYEPLNSHYFDKTQCESCDNSKVVDRYGTDYMVCFDLVCLRKKKSEQTRIDNKAAKEEAREVLEELKTLLSGKSVLDMKDLRFIARSLCDYHVIWTLACKKAFIPWKDLVKDGNDFPAISDIPDEDIPKLILNLVIHQKMNGGAGYPTKQNYEKAIEGW